MATKEIRLKWTQAPDTVTDAVDVWEATHGDYHAEVYYSLIHAHYSYGIVDKTKEPHVHHSGHGYDHVNVAKGRARRHIESIIEWKRQGNA